MSSVALLAVLGCSYLVVEDRAVPVDVARQVVVLHLLPAGQAAAHRTLGFHREGLELLFRDWVAVPPPHVPFQLVLARQLLEAAVVEASKDQVPRLRPHCFLGGRGLCFLGGRGTGDLLREGLLAACLLFARLLYIGLLGRSLRLLLDVFSCRLLEFLGSLLQESVEHVPFDNSGHFAF